MCTWAWGNEGTQTPVGHAQGHTWGHGHTREYGDTRGQGQRYDQGWTPNVPTALSPCSLGPPVPPHHVPLSPPVAPPCSQCPPPSLPPPSPLLVPCTHVLTLSLPPHPQQPYCHVPTIPTSPRPHLHVCMVPMSPPGVPVPMSPLVPMSPPPDAHHIPMSPPCSQHPAPRPHRNSIPVSPSPCPQHPSQCPCTPVTRMLMLKSPSGTISAGTSPGSSRVLPCLSVGTMHQGVHNPVCPPSHLGPQAGPLGPQTDCWCPGRSWSPPGAAHPRATGTGINRDPVSPGTKGTPVSTATSDPMSPSTKGTPVPRATKDVVSLSLKGPQSPRPPRTLCLQAPRGPQYPGSPRTWCPPAPKEPQCPGDTGGDAGDREGIQVTRGATPPILTSTWRMWVTRSLSPQGPRAVIVMGTSPGRKATKVRGTAIAPPGGNSRSWGAPSSAAHMPSATDSVTVTCITITVTHANRMGRG